MPPLPRGTGTSRYYDTVTPPQNISHYTYEQVVLRQLWVQYYNIYVTWTFVMLKYLTEIV